MRKMNAGEFKEIYAEAKKFLALYESINESDITEDTHREDLHYMAVKLERIIRSNREDADKSGPLN